MKKNKNNFINKMAWITMFNEDLCEIYCRYEFDSICIDLEHSQISISQAARLLRIIKMYNKYAYIRLTSKKMIDLNRYLDFGIDGIIVPDIKNKSECENIINQSYYPPIGKRGVGLNRANNFGDNFKNYFEKISNQLKIICIIESVEAVNNLNEILSLKYINGIIIGPYDLSTSLNIPGKFNQKIFKNTILTIEKITKKNNKTIGIHIVEPSKKLIQKYIKKNYNIIIYSLDTVLFKKSVESVLK